MFPSLNERFIKQQRFTQEDQHLFNHHIIENFVESVREMNGVVLIPSKLRDLEPNTTPNQLSINDDLYNYYQMINTVKNDLFEPHHNEEVNNSIFTPKRKISRQQRTNDISTHMPKRKISQGSMSSVSSYSDLASLSQESDNNGNNQEANQQNSTQLTDQFVHHLHSLYAILAHFTNAADYITERYIEEVEVVP
jgi:hypothetical protein